ncbi:MAG: glycosyltransferase [Beijerinckiaceae bacterium]
MTTGGLAQGAASTGARGAEPTARNGASRLQKWSAAVLLLLAGLIPYGLSISFLPFTATLLSPLFLMMIAVQMSALLEEPQSYPLYPEAIQINRQWPRYTLLVPLYNEATIAGQLIKALAALDYPDESKEVLFLIEADDPVTLAALQQHPMPSYMQVLVLPDGKPRTKPRALNLGLQRASGAYVTVYDAEDLPDTDQLKRAIVAFEELPADVVCLQARLAIDNGPDSWFALMMSIEYAALFDVLKRGFAAQGMPVMLGGTSNHFRASALRQLNGWDSWNVTEDADLGLRIARKDWLVADLDSTTLEEAPLSFSSWLGQRRRWLKGWAQTAICHGQQPMRALREMGCVNWLVAMVQIFGVIAGSLSFPLMLAYIAFNVWSGDIFGGETWSAIAINSIALSVILLGIITMVMPAVTGLLRRRSWHLIPWLITLPVYLLLISFAAWYALWDLARRPFHWQKTEHGKGKRRPDIFRRRGALRNTP